jgi:hypothetical protein
MMRDIKGGVNLHAQLHISVVQISRRRRAIAFMGAPLRGNPAWPQTKA